MNCWTFEEVVAEEAEAVAHDRKMAEVVDHWVVEEEAVLEEESED